jgi:bromodomain adjacent to zinc finger domain protein 1A
VQCLVCEIPSTLVYNLRTGPFIRHSALVSLFRLKEDGYQAEPQFGVAVNKSIAAMADVGNNWERVPLRHGGRIKDLEEAFVSGCMKDVCYGYDYL